MKREGELTYLEVRVVVNPQFSEPLISLQPYRVQLVAADIQLLEALEFMQVDLFQLVLP